MAKRERTGNGKLRPIIIRREDGATRGQHSGAWKVAYADFVTAMMAFFLVMWLINATTEEQRKGLADYFSPTNLMSHNSSGTGKPFGGETAFSKGAMVSDMGAVDVTAGLQPVLDNPVSQDRPPTDTPPRGGHGPGRAGTDIIARPASGSGAPAGAAGGSGGQAAAAGAGLVAAGQTGAGQTGAGQTGAGPMETARVEAGTPSGSRPGPAGGGPAPGAGPAPIALPSGLPVTPVQPMRAAPSPADRTQAENHAFAAVSAAIRRLVRQDPALAAVASQLAIDITPRGLRIQLLDSRRTAMFPPGSAVPNPPAQRLLRLIGPIVTRLAGPVRIAGFTDAAPYPGDAMTNWDLSAARANAARRVLTAAGLADRRIQAVTGHGDHDLLLPKDPLAPANRRISILVLRGAAAAASPDP